MSKIALEFSKYLGLVKDTECIDSWIFQLMNKVTPAIMTIASIVVSARQFFGEPIRCDAGLVSNQGSSNMRRLFEFQSFSLPYG